MSDVDPHSPTTAGPAPEPEPVAEPVPEPATTEFGAPAPEPETGAGAYQAPAGSGLLGGAPSGAPMGEDRPELLVGAAFAGGIVAAMLFKRLLGGRD